MTIAAMRWRLLSSFVAALALAGASCSREETLDAAERHRAFEAMMTRVSLVGSSTSFGKEGVTGREEYAIEKVTHVAGDRFLLEAKLELGSRKLTVPIPVTILWAGDTPVITLTDLSIPGLGTYSARVLLFRDHYAGTWIGGDGGGHVFGDIVRRGE
jgi:hypothetical protein